MNGFSNWLRRLGMKLTTGMQRFMYGRYGTDRLNNVILITGVIACIIGLFVNNALFSLLLTLVSYGCMFWAVFRSMSRNTYKRYQENRRFSLLLERLRDRNHRYFTCPKCRQSVRVPKGKGKIAITCPKCRERFIKKT